MLRNRLLGEFDWKAGKEYGGNLGVNIYYSDDEWESVGDGTHRTILWGIEVYDNVVTLNKKDTINVSFTINKVHDINVEVIYVGASDNFREYIGESDYFSDNVCYLYGKYDEDKGRFTIILPELTNFKAYTSTNYFEMAHLYVEPYSVE